MLKTFRRACAVAVVLAAIPYSVELSKTTGITVNSFQAHAVVGRPLTPLSAAGVARRTTRRHLYYHGHHHRCVMVWVHGVHVCR